MRRFRTLPPAGTVIPFSLLLKGLWGAIRPGDARERLGAEIRERYGAQEVHLLNSGRAVLTVLLQAMKEERPDRTEVILPGYTCYSVAAAAVRVGLKVRPVDIDPETFDYHKAALEAVDTSNTLALITANLFGIPNDLPWLEEFSRERGIYMIDDAAQAMHARVGDRWVGTFGDVGLFSFDKGKAITTIQGGVMLVQNPGLSRRIQRLVTALPEPSLTTSFSLVGKLIAYWVFLRPWLYWIPNRLLPLGRTPFEVEYPVEGYPSRLAPLALGSLSLLPELLAARHKKYDELVHTVYPFSPAVKKRSEPIRFGPIRTPVIMPDEDQRSVVLKAAYSAGLGIRSFYPLCIADALTEEAPRHLSPSDTPYSRQVAAGLITIPTGSFLRKADICAVRSLMPSRNCNRKDDQRTHPKA